MTRAMPSIDVVIRLTRDECLAHYEGRAQNVHTRSVDGRKVIFPTSALTRIVGRDGIDGVFRLHFTTAGKFESIEPLSRR